MEHYFVYILYSHSRDRFYIGQTNNIELRLKRHNAGYVKSTKPYVPWILVYQEEFNSRSDAVRREIYLKSLKSKIKIRNIIDTSR